MNRNIAWTAISDLLAFSFPYLSLLNKMSIFRKVFMFTTVLG